MSHNKNHEVRNLVKRINRIEGQVGGIRRMIQDEKPFEEVIIQLNSTKICYPKNQPTIVRSTCRSYVYACSWGLCS